MKVETETATPNHLGFATLTISNSCYMRWEEAHHGFGDLVSSFQVSLRICQRGFIGQVVI